MNSIRLICLVLALCSGSFGAWAEGSHTKVIPIKHGTSTNSIVYLTDSVYRPGTGVTTIWVTMIAGGGAGGAKGGISGGAGTSSSFHGLITVSGGTGGLAGTGGQGGNGANGMEFSGWATVFPAGQRAGQGNGCIYTPCEILLGAAGTMPGAGGGGVAGGLGGQAGQTAYRQSLTVVPGTPYNIVVGKGGTSSNGAGGKGADGFVLIEW